MVYTHRIFFIHSSIEGHLDCFQLLVIVNNAAPSPLNKTTLNCWRELPWQSSGQDSTLPPQGAVDLSLIPGWGTKIPHAVQCNKNKGSWRPFWAAQDVAAVGPLTGRDMVTRLGSFWLNLFFLGWDALFYSINNWVNIQPVLQQSNSSSWVISGHMASLLSWISLVSSGIFVLRVRSFEFSLMNICEVLVKLLRNLTLFECIVLV